MRLNDYADVLSIEACPPIKSGPGEVVTATYHTDRAKVIDLRFERSYESVGTTAEHPFWSVSRQAFVPARKLEIGEQVVTISGQTTRLSDISPRDGPESVYNFEVAGKHTYFVSRDGVLVHNAVYAATILENGRLILQGKTGKFLKHTPENLRQAKRLLSEGMPGLTVLGKFPAYTRLAKKLGANVLNMDQKIWNSLSNAQ